MHIEQPFSFTPPSFTRASGQVRTFNPVYLTGLNVAYTDSPELKIVKASIFPCPKPLILWSGAAYTTIGNWTEAQAEAQITGLLGVNPAQTMSGLYPSN
jgi:hypothetical protein